MKCYIFCKGTFLATQHYSAGTEVEIMTIFGVSESVLMVLYWHFFRNTVIE